MLQFKDFNEQYPQQEKIILGKPFPYRHFQHKTSTETVVMLVGGLGLSDLGYTQVHALSKDFSVITFDYHQCFSTVEELLSAINALLQELGLRVWFVGQSLGGRLAQLLAEQDPDICKGLVLSNTGCLSTNMSKTAKDSLLDMIKQSAKSKKTVKLIPFPLVKKMISKTVMKKYASDFSAEERDVLKNFCGIMERTLEKSYEVHMIDILIQLENHMNSKPEHFVFLEGKVLLVLSNDDHTFHDEVKQALIELMPKPKVYTELTGGHLALLVRCEVYVTLVSHFITSTA